MVLFFARSLLLERVLLPQLVVRNARMLELGVDALLLGGLLVLLVGRLVLGERILPLERSEVHGLLLRVLRSSLVARFI